MISITQSRGGEKYPTYNKIRKTNWIGHILRRKFCTTQEEGEK